MLKDNYWIYGELLETGLKQINTTEITSDNWKLHYDSIFNIMLDKIETIESRHMFIRVTFDYTDDKDTIDLSLYDYLLNLTFWWLQVSVNKPILPKHLYFKDTVTGKDLKNYIDKFFIPQNKKEISIIEMNNIIDTSMYNFVRIDDFSMYLSNTMNMSDFVRLKMENKEIDDIMHSDFSNVELSDIKKYGMDAMSRFFDIVRNDRNNCLSYFVRASEGLNKKQAKEVLVNIGTKPDGLGGVFPYQINTNYFMGGVNEVIPMFIDASTSRLAQIIINRNVGDSGHFSRLIGLNNLDTKLHEDKNYCCDVHPDNLQVIYVENLEMVNRMAGQYYRLDKWGMEYCIERNDASLIGKTIYKRSPMTCASAARGEGICYKCYGDLAYTNNNINIGKISAEILSSEITQRMLSAKHLIDTIMSKIEWTSEIFKELFEIDFNILKLQSHLDLTGYKLVIDTSNIECESEEDESDSKFMGIYMNSYINEFEIITPDGRVEKLSTVDYQNIYLAPELEFYINEKMSQNKLEDDILTANLTDFHDMSLFSIKLNNNDLTKALDKVTGVLDRSKEVAKYDKNSILQEFMMILQECNLSIHAAHCEVLLMNQIRRASDILKKPQWEYANQTDYVIFPLKKSLQLNPSVTVSLMFQRIKKILIEPETYQKEDPSVCDMFFMKNPTEYLSDKYVERTIKNTTKKIIHYPTKEEVK